MTTGEIREYPRIMFLKLFRQFFALGLLASNLLTSNRKKTAGEKLLIVAPLSFML